MCGRFTLKTPASQLLQQLPLSIDFESLGDLPPRYNIAPIQNIIAFTAAEDNIATLSMRWGLVPHWADDLAIGNNMINARSETVKEKPTFKRPFAKQRCLVPADGYFEWKASETDSKSSKQPFWIHLPEEKPFLFAGLWDWNLKATGEKIFSCTIFTTEAAPEISHLHDRMPVLIPAEAYDVWLRSENIKEVEALIREPQYNNSFGPHLWRYRAVSTQVNNPRHDDPSNIAAIPSSENND
jgi:putative SOS response-associated peptidase YedK